MATPVGRPVQPVATPNTVHTLPATPVTIDVLANDTGDGLHVVGGTNGAHTFGYSIRDSARLSAISTVAVTVAAAEPPVGGDDADGPDKTDDEGEDSADDRALPDTGAPASAGPITILGAALVGAGIWLLRRSRRQLV